MTAVAFYALTRTRLPEHTAGQSLAQRLAPLRHLQVWRFGLYYVAVFGGFVALSQWMIGYYVNVYDMSVSTAGLLTACFSLPSGSMCADLVSTQLLVIEMVKGTGGIGHSR